MANTFNGGFITVSATGKSVTTGAIASAAQTIPLDSSGNVPKFVRIAATQAAAVRLGGATVTAVATDLLVQPADAVVVSTNGSIS